MTGWETVKLGDLYEVHNGLSKGGKFFGEGYPFLTFATVFNNWFIPDELTELVQSSQAEQESYSIQRGDVFITRTSETSDELGMSCVALKNYPQATYNGFTKRLRPSTDRVLPEYIGYYLRLPSFRAGFQAFSTMTTRASLRNEDLLNMTIALPSIELQERIAEILSAYDYLISNNQKQIKLLEEAARRLYREWFVDLHFPGYEKSLITNGIPRGWKKERASNLLTVSRGKSYSSAELSAEEGVLLINLSNIQAYGGYNRQQEKRFSGKYKEEQLVCPNDLIMGVTDMTQERRTVGRVALIPKLHEKAIISMDLIKLEPHNGSTLFYYAMFRYGDYGELISRFANGTNVLHLRPEALSRIEVLMPTIEIQDRYTQEFSLIQEQINVLQDQIISATEARDRLLPKLLSEEIEL